MNNSFETIKEKTVHKTIYDQLQKKEWGTFWSWFGRIRKQRLFDMKLSAIVELSISSHSYKFQPDSSNLCLIAVLEGFRVNNFRNL
jgi:hypothetical protein